MKAEELTKLFESAINLLNFAHNKGEKRYELGIKEAIGIHSFNIIYNNKIVVHYVVKYDTKLNTPLEVVELIENSLTNNLVSLIAAGIYHNKEQYKHIKLSKDL